MYLLKRNIVLLVFFTLCFAIKGFTQTVTIVASSFVFTPDSVTITVGDTVCFQGISGFHPLVFASDSSTLYFTDTCFVLPLGIHGFFCNNHGLGGMVGAVTVLFPVNITGTDVSCNGLCDGSATANASGGTTPYTYLWDDDSLQTTQTATGLCPGTYSVLVTDLLGETGTASVVINEPTVLTLNNISKTDVTCNGFCDGTAIATFSGGTPPYNYLWSDGQTNQTAINLCPDTFCVTVTDTNGCSDSACITITEPLVLSITITFNNVSCFGACDGDATAAVLGGTAPYTYQWDAGTGFQTTQTAVNLCNGFYNVLVTDSNGCIITGVVLILQPQELSLVVDSITPSICSLPNGGACVNVLGGSSPYVIQWDDTDSTVGACIDSVYAGVYNPVVTDANGCTATLPVTITDIPSPIIDSILTADDDCYGNCIGTATVLSVTGTGPFEYYWTDSIGDTLNNVFIGENTVDSLCAGPYTVIVVDVSTGCITPGVFTLNKPAPLNSTIFLSNPVSCYGFCDGDVLVSVAGGTPPYTYLWSNGDVEPLADSLCPGVHFVNVVDSLGCSDTSNVLITQPDSLEINPAVTDVSCFGGCDGAISLNASGGTPPYTYNFTTGLCAGTYNATVTDLNGCIRSQTIVVNQPSQLTATVTSIPSTCGDTNGLAIVSPSDGTPPYSPQWDDALSQTNDTATGLLAGNYNVTITDSNGCILIIPVTIIDLPGATIDSISTTDVNCNGICDGTAALGISGGTPPLSYSWNTIPVQSTQTATGLCAATYIITVTDFNGCITIDSVIINEPDILVATTFGDTTTCNGDITQISATASGGVGAYAYSWDNGLPDTTTHTVSPGSTTTYTVTVTDGNGCTDSSSVTVMIYLPLMINFTDTVICLGDIITISANVTGGCGNYSYLWNTSDVIDPITVLPTDTTVYSVIVDDGCCPPSVTDSIVVGTVGGPAPTVNLGADATICDGDSIILDAAGTGPLSYSWSTGSNDQTIVVNTGGTYYVTVTDTNNNVCMGSDTINITVEICPGVDGFQVSSFKFQVYPNPNTGEFVIEMLAPKAQGVLIKIVNVLGQEVYTEIAAMTTGISRKQIDMASYPRGIYTLQIITDEGVYNKKVIVE